jgi:hypothetical protein
MTEPLPVPNHASGVVACPPGRHSVVRRNGQMWDHSPAACQLPSHHDHRTQKSAGACR